MWNQKPSFRFEIENFSEKESVIASQTFVGGGCEWNIFVYPKGESLCADHMSLYLSVGNRESLRTGWKRSAAFYFVVLNQSDKELYRSSIAPASTLFCAKNPTLGFRKTLLLSKFNEKRFLDKDRVIIEVYIKVAKAVDGEGGDLSEKQETWDIHGFQAFAAHVNTSVRKIFAEHVVKTEYKNVLSNACSKLSEMAEVGSKLDWLKSRLDEVSLKRKKADDVEGSRVQKLEERIKNLELMDSGLKMDGLRSNLEEILLERKKSYDANESRVQKLEERVKNLEMMELNVKLVCLKLKLEEVSLERKKSDDADDSRVQQLEESFKNLEMIVSDLKVELDHATKSSVDEIFLVEESFKNLEMMVLELKAEMEEGNAKYSSDEFFLVDEVE